MTAALGINKQVNETLGIIVELKMMPQVTNSIEQILFLAYGGSHNVKTLNQTLYPMRWMVRFEVEILASVDWFSPKFNG
jgi:hypothetical protein